VQLVNESVAKPNGAEDCANGGVITNIDASVPMRQLQFAFRVQFQFALIKRWAADSLVGSPLTCLLSLSLLQRGCRQQCVCGQSGSWERSVSL
jgi:hypothetical protein